MKFSHWILALAFMLPAMALAEVAAVADCAPQLVAPWNKKISFSAVEKILREGKVVDIRDMRQSLKENGKHPSGTVGALLVTFEDGTRAVFKPNNWGLAEAEEGAYKIARKLLKSRQIPPTVLRDLGPDLERFREQLPEKALGFSEGSLQYFVNSKFDITNHRVWQEIEPKISERQKTNRDLFYFVFGQWDRHRGNLIVDDSLTFALIDNAQIRDRQQARYGERPYQARIWFSANAQRQDWPEHFPFASARVFDHPKPEEVREFLGDNIDSERWERFAKHWAYDDKGNLKADLSCAIVLWQNIAWIQSIGYHKYDPIQLKVITQKSYAAYAALTFDSLRGVLSPKAFPDVMIREFLEKRDQVLRAAETIPRIQ